MRSPGQRPHGGGGFAQTDLAPKVLSSPEFALAVGFAQLGGGSDESWRGALSIAQRQIPARVAEGAAGDDRRVESLRGIKLGGWGRRWRRAEPPGPLAEPRGGYGRRSLGAAWPMRDSPSFADTSPRPHRILEPGSSVFFPTNDLPPVKDWSAWHGSTRPLRLGPVDVRRTRIS
jgi:hypothetical protein